MKFFGKNFLLYLIICLLSFISHSYASTSNEVTAVAVGENIPGSNDVPLLLSKDATTQKWSQAQTIVGLKTNENVSLSAVNCEGKVCLAGGVRSNGGKTILLLRSIDGGKTWEKIQLNIDLSHHEYSHITTIKCLGSTCFSAGVIDKGVLLLRSEDTGKSWSTTIVDVPTEVIAEKTNLEKVTCHGETCIAAGSYRTPWDSYPLLLVSHDQGKFWQLGTVINPTKYYRGQIFDLSCTDKICAAVGIYELENYNFHPLLLTSNDNGVTWLRENKITAQSIVDRNFFKSVSCIEKTCIASGTGRQPEGRFPLVVSSQDEGNSWKIINEIKGLPYTSFGSFYSSCITHNFCVLAGSTFSNGKLAPIFLTSHDAGQTWSPTNGVANFPSGIYSSRTLGFNCSQSGCLVTGFFTTYDPWGREDASRPLLIESDPTMQSWTMVRDFTNIPKKHYGTLYASSF